MKAMRAMRKCSTDFSNQLNSFMSPNMTDVFSQGRLADPPNLKIHSGEHSINELPLALKLAKSHLFF